MLALESNAVYAGPVARVSVSRLFHVEDDAVSALSELTENQSPEWPLTMNTLMKKAKQK